MIQDKTVAEFEKPADEEEEEKDEETTESEAAEEEMDEEKEKEEATAKAASISDLKSIGSAEFALACAEAGLTLAQARVLADADKARAAEVATLRAQVERLKSGQEPVDSTPPSGEQVATVDKLEAQMKAEWAKRHIAGSPAHGGFSSFEAFRALRIRELTGKEHSK